MNRHHARANIANQRGDREGRNFPWSPVDQATKLLLVGKHASDTRAHNYADLIRILLIEIQSGVGDCLSGCHKAKVRVAIVPARILGIHVLIHIPVPNLGTDMTGIGFRIEQTHAINAGLTRLQAGPK